jgi:hypothetical protein
VAALADAASRDVLAHSSLGAPQPVLVDQPSPDPLGRAPLLARSMPSGLKPSSITAPDTPPAAAPAILRPLPGGDTAVQRLTHRLPMHPIPLRARSLR